MKSFIDELDLPKDFLFQIISLFVSILIIHTIYLLFVDPAAAKEVAIAIDQNKAPNRTLAVVLKDFEQEACIILFCWALSMIFIKWKAVSTQANFIKVDFLANSADSNIDLSKAKLLRTEVDQWLIDSKNNNLIASSLWSGLNSFVVSNDLSDAKKSAHTVCDNEASRIESELSMIRYIIWAIPSIGFIGTVRGIGGALSQAHIAVQGDIATMTASLGIAFNSTFVALAVSIFLMFFLHQLQLLQDRLIINIHGYCDKKLLSNLVI
jgi:biopolymer transport protein ExbB/TolQ|tara:strand:+ start:2799 stop:3596 length:798 start_codon:yes stop_codon:yes gene_type:complete